MKGHVHKRGKSWYYRFDIEPDPLTGKRRQVNGSGYKTEREAWKACRDAMAEHEKGRLVSSSRRKVGEALNEWLTRIEHSIKPSMAQNWRNYAAYYVVPYIGSRDVREIDGAVCDALYAKLLAEGRVKARPTKPPTTQAVHARRFARDGREMPCRPYSYDTARCHRRHAENDPLIGQPIKPKKLGRRAAEDAAEAAQRKLAPGLGAQDGRQRTSHASPGLGGFRGLGMGQAERRQRRTPSTRAAQGPEGVDGRSASTISAVRPV